MATDPSRARTADRIAQDLRAAEYTLQITIPGAPEHEVAVQRVQQLTEELLAVVELGPAPHEADDQ